MVRAVPVAPRAASIENPRLMIALIAVIDAQKMNGTVIRNPYNWADAIAKESHSLLITRVRLFDVSRSRDVHGTDIRKCPVSLVQLGGLEPPTSCSTDRRSNQLSYNCILCRPRKGGSNGAETRCN